ncbi:hypothetical protein F5Y19DRAFT_442809 [Xylariaceae sp. FL1651]|nr:hypothetical protein F5Y19DRAFT_442809 [Xylariaceae sp. FL1651]
MIHVEPSRRTQLRRACDRCHQAKLRCLRDDNINGCQRCLHAKVDCLFSPPVKQRRQTRAWTSGAINITTWDNSSSSVPRSTASLRSRRVAAARETSVPKGHKDKAQSGAVVPSEATPRSALNNTGDAVNENNESYQDNMELDPTQPKDGVASSKNRVSSGDPSSSSSFIAKKLFIASLLPTSTSPASEAGRPPLTTPAATVSISESSSSGIGRLDETSPTPHENGCDEVVIWLRKISDLSICLTEHLMSIPTHSSNDTNNDPLQLYHGKPTSIDETFHLSQQFIDVLSNICPKLPPLSFPVGAVSNKIDTPAVFSLDPASELLVFSAYLRFLEIYDRTIQNIQLSFTQTPSDSIIQRPFQVPGLTIGSFSLSSDSEFQLLLLVNLMENMISRARELVVELTSPKKTAGYRGDFQSFGGVSMVIVPDLALCAIRTRENALTRMLNELKGSMLRHGRP